MAAANPVNQYAALAPATVLVQLARLSLNLALLFHTERHGLRGAQRGARASAIALAAIGAAQ